MPKSISERKCVIRISDCLDDEDLKEMELYLKQKYNVIKINRLLRLDGQKWSQPVHCILMEICQIKIFMGH